MNKKPRKYPMRPMAHPQIGQFLITSATWQNWPYQSLMLTLESVGPVNLSALPPRPVTVRGDRAVSSVVVLELQDEKGSQ